ncbi:unnamed protein product [Ceutorhynchus assimilis]|uniref:Partial AB-hydrolase lipase domain-containing protein n=1 Tax=Ceutorhynchus assimilis TaxID=467358 RepID=A0A9N9QKY8_9CUCU|nr:unnamed protein product [Ceutorhynchus assimilis]
MSSNSKCWYDPDLGGTPQELAQNNGFLLEEHQVTTEDEYILPLYRLKNLDGSYGSQPIFLQHGMSADAYCMMVNKEDSIPYYLARKGYDIWIGNYRNCEYCRHATLTTSDPKYWEFSYHENALYDLPANFEYIKNLTGQKIIPIGHSMGSTGLAAYASVMPMEAEKYLKHAILVSPAIYFKNNDGFVSKGMIESAHEMIVILPIIGYNRIMTKDSFERLATKRFFYSTLDNAKFTKVALSAVFGKFTHPSEPAKFPLLIDSLRTVSFKTMQNMHSREFRMFDYGPEQNMVRYGKEIPPDYDMGKITNSISLVYGLYDTLAGRENIVAAYQRYQKPNWDIFEIPHNHVDLLFSRDARKTILPLLSKIISKVIRKRD